ncbi:MAG: hypothetical protein KGL99_12735 [Burkholderiales bacterium]|nr:hypothetical protein [Burkholderiales bacterium]
MMQARCQTRGWAALPAGIIAIAWVSDAAAQAQVPTHWLTPVWGAPAHCAATLEALDRHLAEPGVDDLIGVAQQFEAGVCLERDETRASQFYAQAARRGSAQAARALAARFGAGRGVPQSYANAGAWLAGKGDTDERIEPWDYSVGLAFTFIATVLDRLQWPQSGWPPDLELNLALDADAQQAGKLWWRYTGAANAQAEALRRPLGDAIDAAATVAAARMVPGNPEYVVPVRVTLPLSVRRTSDGGFAVSEHDLILH